MPKIPSSVIIRRVQNGYVVTGESEYVFSSPMGLADGIQKLFTKGDLEAWIWKNYSDQQPAAVEDVPF